MPVSRSRTHHIRSLPTSGNELAARYGARFDGFGLAYYRDARDSVAMHRDREMKLARRHRRRDPDAGCAAAVPRPAQKRQLRPRRRARPLPRERRPHGVRRTVPGRLAARRTESATRRARPYLHPDAAHVGPRPARDDTDLLRAPRVLAKALTMARLAQRHPENVEGDWYVDTRCFDCDVARHHAPELIVALRDGQSVVARQPVTPAEELEMWRAAARVPDTFDRHRVASIATARGVPVGGHTRRVPVRAQRPPIVRRALVVRAACRRRALDRRAALRPHARRRVRASCGGIAHVLLSHRDDVADAEKYARRVRCTGVDPRGRRATRRRSHPT